jgi:hypothetical protein
LYSSVAARHIAGVLFPARVRGVIFLPPAFYTRKDEVLSRRRDNHLVYLLNFAVFVSLKPYEIRLDLTDLRDFIGTTLRTSGIPQLEESLV